MKGIHVCRIAYVEEAIEAERRYRRGERQLHCGMCRNGFGGVGRWVWPGECIHPGRKTLAEFNAVSRAVQSYVKKNYPTQEARLTKRFRAAVKQGEL